MGYDTLVNGDYLNDGLKAIADGIRQGSGVSGKMTFPDGMAEAAAQKCSGIPEIFERLVGLSSGFNGVTSLPDILALDLSFIKSGKCVLHQTFRGCTSLKELTLTIPDGAELSLGLCFYSCRALKKVTLRGDFVHAMKEAYGGASEALGAFAMCSELEEISSSRPLGIKYVSSQMGYYNPFYGCTALKEVRFERMAAAGDWVMRWSPALSDETLISIANALVIGSMTLTLHATAAARCAEIIGREDADINGECFIAAEDGDITLEDYITNIKGWSIVSD